MQRSLRKQLLSGENKVAVWGAGYIRFSTMANFASMGVRCVGTDVSTDIVDLINTGKVPVPNMEYWLGFDAVPLAKSGIMRATTDRKELIEREFAVHLIAIPTEKGENPWAGGLEDVASKLSTLPIPGLDNPAGNNRIYANTKHD
jgi:UDP-N-acetyl-D-mannosaminuronate dehydrogenase